MGAGLHGLNGLNPATFIPLINIYVLPRLLYGLECLVLKRARDTTPWKLLQRSAKKNTTSTASGLLSAAGHHMNRSTPAHQDMDLVLSVIKPGLAWAPAMCKTVIHQRKCIIQLVHICQEVTDNVWPTNPGPAPRSRSNQGEVENATLPDNNIVMAWAAPGGSHIHEDPVLSKYGSLQNWQMSPDTGCVNRPTYSIEGNVASKNALTKISSAYKPHLKQQIFNMPLL